MNNLLILFRGFRMATLLNVIGLSIAFTAFMVLMMQISYDWGFDRFHKNADRLYRVEMATPTDGAMAVLPRPFVEAFFTSSPHIRQSAIVNKWDNKRNIAVEHNGDRVGYEELYEKVSPSYPELFNFQIIEGDPQTLDHPNKVLIPESMAKRLFPHVSAVGQRLDSEELKVEIGGVYKDLPQNSIVSNAIYQSIPDSEGAGQWEFHNHQAYVMLDDPARAEWVLSNFEKNFRPKEYSMRENKLRLTKMPDIYYLTDINMDSQTTKGSKLQLFVLFGIALLIVFIAAINFTNFSNSLVPIRLKSVNTQKVLGSTIRSLRFAMLSEAIILCLFSYLIALLILFLLSDTSLKDMISGGISLSRNLGLVVGTGFFAFAIGLLAGLWPAYHITSFAPALALKGNFGLTPRGKELRNVLVGVQFTSAFVLIIGALFINLQNRYMTRSTLKIDRDQVAVIKLNNKLSQQTDLLNSELKALSGIVESATVDRVIGGEDSYMTMGRTYKGENCQFQAINADISILKVLGMTVNDGRDFMESDLRGSAVYIFNEKARREFGLEPGSVMELDWMDWHLREEVVGFIDDVKYNSYRSDIGPFGFTTSGFNKRYAMIRVAAGTDYRQLREDVQQALTRLDPDCPFQMTLYNEVLDNFYRKDIILGQQITFFSFIAILLSMIGVFGTVLFESAYKRREIAIRKVFGSTIREILLLLNYRYVRILIICFLIAIPVAWKAIASWLENFTYRTPMYAWVFVLSFVVVSMVTLFTISFQNWRAAQVNPVDSLKTNG